MSVLGVEDLVSKGRGSPTQNEMHSFRNVKKLRGLLDQCPPHDQDKLIGKKKTRANLR